MNQRVDVRMTSWGRISEFLGETKIARMVMMFVLGAAGSIPLVFLTPPFQVPDEMQHFYRAYELSELRMRAQVQNGVAGDTLPQSLIQLVQSSVYTADGINYPITPAPIAKTLKLASIPLDKSKTQFVAFAGSAFYSPLPYLPQALGIALGRALGLGPLYLLYLGRLFNCVAALALIGFAVYVMPRAEELILIIGLLPMCLFLYSSLSPDASVIACALAFTALSFSASVRRHWRPLDIVIATGAAAVFCSLKPVYTPILLSGLVPGLFRSDEIAKAIRSHVIILTVTLGFTIGWLVFAKSAITPPLDGARPELQAIFVLQHPAFFVRTIVHTLRLETILSYYIEAVGTFGWLTVMIRPLSVYVLPLLSFFLVWIFGFRGTVKSSVGLSLCHIALVIASALLVMTAMYLMWTQVGQDHIEGVQGRYFLPILGLAGMAVLELAPNTCPIGPKWLALGTLSAIIVIEVVAMDATIIRAFQVLSSVHSGHY